MAEFFARLKQRKLVQWAVAYVAGAWVVLQVLDLALDSYRWPNAVMHIAFGVLAIGFVLVLLLAWYHGERGIQRVSGVELLIIALVLAVGGGVLWQFEHTSPTAARMAATATPASSAKPHTAGIAATKVATAASAQAPATGALVARPIPAKSVAVLPFENLSADKANAYFADGIQDLILTKLADIGDLKVIARTSTESYGSHPENLTLVGKQLGVATILEGSVQKAGNQVLINVQLIDAKTDAHIWAQTYTRTLTNIFGVEGEVAEKVAKALNAKLTAAETARVTKVPTRNKQAYQAFLKASYYHDQFNRTGDGDTLDKSIALYKQAVAADPNFANAWVALALDYADTSNHRKDEQTAVLHALALDPNNASAHRVYAFVLMDQREPDKAIAQAQEGVRLNPKGPYEYAGLGFVYTHAGRFDEAEAAFAHCVKLVPRENFCRRWRSNIQMMQRRYASARDTLRDVLNRDPADIIAATKLAYVYVVGWADLGAARKALQSVTTPVSASGALSDAWYWIDLYARDYPAALAVIRQAPASWFRLLGQPLALYEARVYLADGDHPRAQQAFARVRDVATARLQSRPENAPLRAHLALALAGLGDAKAASQQIQRAAKYASAPYRNQLLLDRAVVDAWSGNTGASLKVLDGMLAQPTGDVISVNLLKLDPEWDPIRRDPRFQALLKKYAKPAPAAAASVGTGHD